MSRNASLMFHCQVSLKHPIYESRQSCRRAKECMPMTAACAKMPCILSKSELLRIKKKTTNQQLCFLGFKSKLLSVIQWGIVDMKLLLYLLKICFLSCFPLCSFPYPQECLVDSLLLSTKWSSMLRENVPQAAICHLFLVSV